MGDPDSRGPVVVGIDGSSAAIEAALWAIDEAISRDVPLRLVHVTHIGSAMRKSVDDDFRLDVEYAESALRAAHAAVDASGKPVKVETALLHGDLVTVLIDESRHASLMCVGSVGIGCIARRVLGSTAAALAERARCPVAIIRSDTGYPADSDWVAVVVEDNGDDAVLRHAFAEARLRHTAILALCGWSSSLGEIPYDELDRRLGAWAREYPEIHVQPVAAHSGFVHYLATHGDPVQLVVVGNADAGQVPRVLGPHQYPVLPHPGCSVLVVHQ